MLFGGTYAMYAAVPALVLNLVVSAGLTVVMRAMKAGEGSDATAVEDYA